MTPELWERLKPIFDAALETAPADRSSFVEEACGTDQTLRRELDRLLAAHSQQDATLEEIALNLKNLTRDGGVLFSPSEIILDRFKILRHLGSGGMGEVYEARDLRLGQTIAMKSIRHEIAADEQVVSQFKKEVQLARRLSGPNICRIHEFFELSEGKQKSARAFLTMEFLDGITVAEKLRQSGPLSWEDLRPIAVDICSALATMHQAGIVHRDLKCRNIMLAERNGAKRAVLMDFGLARELSPALQDTAASSIHGVIVGTPEYMAPEQFEGKAVSPATDIYALGVVLYECLTGKRPFAFPRAVGAALLRGKKPELPPSVPAPVKRAIDRCLELDPNDRYQSSNEVADALTMPRWRNRKLAPAATGTIVLAVLLITALWRVWFERSAESGPVPARSIAVLPLQNLTGDPGQDYFVDGMTDELTTNLAQIATLRVPSRTSTMRFKDTKLPISEIARQLNVDEVLEGSVMRSGQRVRITAQLIEAKSDRHIWAKSYEQESRDLLALQDELARDIAGEVRVSLGAGDRKRLTASQTVDPAAYESYLRGRYLWNRRTEPELQKAKEYFEDSIAKDPGFAPAHAGLADTYFYLSYAWGHLPPLEGMPLAKAAALKAIELDNDEAEGHASLGEVKLFYDWDFPGAEREIREAIALNPNDEDAHHIYSALLGLEGRMDDAVAESRKAVEADPLSVPATFFYASMLQQNHRCSEARAVIQKGYELDPNPTHVGMLHGVLESCLREEGKTREAFEEEVKVRIAEGAGATQIEELRQLFARSGFKGIEKRKLKDEMEAWNKDHWHLHATNVAWLYADLGDYDHAFAWVDKCIELRSTVLIWIYAKNSPFYNQPRLAEVKRKMGVQF